MGRKLQVRVGDTWYEVEVEDLESSPVRVLVNGQPVEVELESLPPSEPEPTRPEPDSVRRSEARAPAPSTASARKVFRSPMPGVVLSLDVKEGDQVVTGDQVCVLEAMKMQQVLRADWSGVVRVVHVVPGQQVLDGDPIVELE